MFSLFGVDHLNYAKQEIWIPYFMGICCDFLFIDLRISIDVWKTAETQDIIILLL